MADNTTDAVRAARRAMDQVIGPALGSADGLVREQAQLVAQTLGLLEAQLPHIRGRTVHELRCHREIAGRVRELVPDGAGEALDHATGHADRLLDALGPSNQELQAATAELTALVSAVVRTSADLTPEARGDILRCVVDLSDGVIAGQRSWFAGQGWGGSGTVRPIEEMFDDTPTAPGERSSR